MQNNQEKRRWSNFYNGTKEHEQLMHKLKKQKQSLLSFRLSITFKLEIIFKLSSSS